jgi:hypothetical protein
MLAVLGLLLLPWDVRGYRPFVSTDAAVAEPQQAEIELGHVTRERAQAAHTFIVPRLVLNYGLVSNLELVGEFQLEWSPESEIAFVDPALSLKVVLREREDGRHTMSPHRPRISTVVLSLKKS